MNFIMAGSFLAPSWRPARLYEVALSLKVNHLTHFTNDNAVATLMTHLSDATAATAKRDTTQRSAIDRLWHS